MQLGFCSAILADCSLDEVLRFAADAEFDCVELMCWPPGKAERRYAGVTHIDVESLDDAGAAAIRERCEELGVAISGLGYYPNPLAPAAEEAEIAASHLAKLICAAPKLGIDRVNSFIGRDWTKSVDDNWPRMLDVWRPLVRLAEQQSVRIGIENCPMLFTADEWPGGKNLATSPSIWRRLFADLDSPQIGLNYDPSHMVWQQMDYLAPLRDFADRLHHVHAKDVRVDRHRLDQVGILAHPLQYHTPKLPGLGDIDWGQFCSVLSDNGYDGPVCIEVEDRAYEGSLERRKQSLVQSGRYLRNFIA
ncbi:MAG: sugar phosphate isomerase/epimerase [Planctomycetales bacterium]|nr:sugar phosphate isomerase/epimerase [Planctomycetales bacterium]